MAQKKKLTAAQRRRKQEYETIFLNGRQVRVKKEPLIDGLPVDEFVRRNADPIYLVQTEAWEELHAREQDFFPVTEATQRSSQASRKVDDEEDYEIPF